LAGGTGCGKASKKEERVARKKNSNQQSGLHKEDREYSDETKGRD
jgi:hypothetical protein